MTKSTSFPSKGPVVADLRPTAAGSTSHKYTVEKIVDPLSPLCGRWRVRRDGVHVATSNTRGGALRLKRNYEDLQGIGRK